MKPKMQDLIDKYQPLLRISEQDDDLVINFATAERGTKPEDSYVSNVTRTKIEGTRGDGTSYKSSFISKVPLGDQKIVEMCRINHSFQNEAHFYKNILPQLGPFAPRCILATSQELILEDLNTRNYYVHDKRKMLDFDHCKIVMQILASYHASSLAWQLRDPQTVDELVKPLKEVLYPPDSGPAIGHCLIAGLELAKRCILFESEMTEKVQQSINLLTSYQQNGYVKIQKLIQSNHGKYQILTHSDSYINNMLFSYGSDGKVINVKLIDFQNVKRFSPALDLSYFLFSSSISEVLENNLEDLLKIYHDFFIHDLRRLDVREDDLCAVSYSWLLNEIKSFGSVGFITALVTVQALLMDENEKLPIDMDVDFSTDTTWVDKVPLTAKKSKRIRLMVEKYMTLL